MAARSGETWVDVCRPCIEDEHLRSFTPPPSHAVTIMLAVFALLGCAGSAPPGGSPLALSAAGVDRAPSRSDTVSSVASRKTSAGRSACGAPITYSIFEADAYGSDWSKANDLIAFNRLASDGYYHIYTVRPDGDNLRQVGLGSATFPGRTTGSPAWSPSGAYMAFVAEKTTHIPGNLKGRDVCSDPRLGRLFGLMDIHRGWVTSLATDGSSDR